MTTRPTEIAYSDTNWATCPNCDSELIQAGSFDIDHNIAWQSVTCEVCGTLWVEEYKATQRTNIEYP